MAQQDRTDPACLVPAEEAVLEVVEEPRPADVPCAHCGTLCSPDMPYCSAECLRLAEGPEPRQAAVQCHHCRQQIPVLTHPALCHFCGKRLDFDVTEYDPEASDLLDSVSPGESAALIQEVEARTDEASFRQAAAAESERCAKMAQQLEDFAERLGRHLACVQRQHARYASRAELLRRYLSSDPSDETAPL